MGSDARDYMRELGAQVASHLGADWQFLKSRLELRRPHGEGRDVVILAAATRYSPEILMHLHFGRAFNEAAPFRKLIGVAAPYEVHQNTGNLRHMAGLDYSGTGQWKLDIRDPITPVLVSDVGNAILGIAYPFFDRFEDILAARDGVAGDDPWCLGGQLSWQSVLVLDAALGDIGHFEQWVHPSSDYERARIDQALACLKPAAQQRHRADGVR